MGIKKHFVLSPETLVSKEKVTLSFGSDNNIYVPFEAIEEIERKYYEQITERGKVARHVLEYLGSFHISGLKRGVAQENGSILRVVTRDESSEETIKIECSELDRRILQACLKVKSKIPEGEIVVLVSKKASLRKKAEMLGIKAQTFRDEFLPEIAEQYTGRKVIQVSDSKLKKFREKGEIAVTEVIPDEERKEVFTNMFVIMKAKSIGQEYGRVFNKKIVPLSTRTYYPSQVTPKNDGQRFVIEALMMDSDIAPLVIIKGPAGTGKTYLSLAAGLEHVENHVFPRNILISRAAVEMGEKLGALPGSEQEKMGPYVRGIKDNLEELINKRERKTSNKSGSRKKVQVSYTSCEMDEEDEKPQVEDGTIFFENGLIRLEAINYIRGRNIVGTYMVIDEAQNLTPTEIKTIITRVGRGTKLILMGDPAQIDRPELDERNNGISYASERMKGDDTCWQITMREEESVRSELAKRASMLL